MTQPATFTQDGAKRIVNAVRQWEQDNGQIAERQPVSKPSTPPVMLVKTPSSLPGGYTGSTALDGTVVEWVTGTSAFTTIASSVWIKSLNGEALAAGTVYNARFNGTFAQSGTTKSLFMVEAAGSGLSSNYIGETCQGYYNGGSRVTTGGAYGYGYTEVSVPVGASTAPYGTLETWRLHHGAELNTTNGCWAAGVYTGSVTPSSYKIPTIDTTAYRLRFSGKRGDLVSGTTYNCYQYQLNALTVSGRVKFFNGQPAAYFQFTNKSGTAYTDQFLEMAYAPGVANPGIYSGEMEGYAMGWKALANGANSWAIMYPSIYHRIDSAIAWIGFTQDTGWFIQSVTNHVTQIASSAAGPISQAQT